MSLSLAIDDTSLLLLILIVSLLLFSALSSRWYQPTIHPLILGRQSDTSQVHNKDESPSYRNANSPHGFDLATKPGKNVHDVKALLEDKKNAGKRVIYGAQKSNADLVDEAQRFARGVAILASGEPSSLAVTVERDTWFSLVAILAGSLHRPAKLDALVIPPLHLPQGQPSQFPGPTKRLSAVVTTAEAIHKAAAMGIADSNTLFILENQEQASLAQRNLGDRKVNITTYREVLEKGDSSGEKDTSSQGDKTAASFWLGEQWTQVPEQAITAGVTTYLAYYPADKIPTEKDSIYIEQSPFASSPSLHLGAAATPAGLTLALTALYTGSSIDVGPLTTSLTDPNPTTHTQLAKSNATILYTSAIGASSLGLALTASSKKPPYGKLLYAGKLRTLRHGALRKDSIYDALLFNPIRKSLGLNTIRAVTIVGDGWVIPQRLLDVLRAHLGVPIMNAYLPTKPYTTAPISSSHAYDIQTFKANNDISELPAHVGPPAVSVELKIVRDSDPGQSSTPHGWERFSSADDVIGRILVRGTILTESDRDTWQSIPLVDSDGEAHGLFRSNGTLLVLPPSIHDEKKHMVPIPTMSAKFPMKGRNKIGAGNEQDVRDQERGQGKKDV